MTEPSKVRWVRHAVQKLPSAPQALRVINEQLWCCCGAAGIVVFDSELGEQRTVAAADMGPFNDVAELSNGDVIIATDNWLYTKNSAGRHASCVKSPVSRAVKDW